MIVHIRLSVFVVLSWLTMSRSSGAFTVSIESPSSNEIVGDSLTVVASSDSVYEITTGTATASGAAQTSAMISGSRWTGMVSFAGGARGVRTMTVTLTDASGATASSSVDVNLDRP